MKQILSSLLTVIILTTIFSCSKKIAPLKIDYDFNNLGSLDSTKFAEPGQNIILNLTNINPNIYNVSVDDSIVVYEKQKPDQFDLFNKTPDLKSIVTSVDTLSANPDGGAAGSPSARASARAYTQKKAKTNTLDAELKLLLENDYPDLVKEVEIVLTYSDMSAELNKLSINCTISQADKKIQAKAYLISNFPELIENQLPTGVESYITRKIEDKKSRIVNIEAVANLLIKKYIVVKKTTDPNISLSQYREIEENTDEKISSLKNVLENVSKLKEKLIEFEKLKPGKAIVDAYNNVLNAEINKVVKKFIPRKASDEYLLKVKIEKKVATLNCNSEPTSFTIPVYVEKGIKIDFSTGVVFNFGRDKFFDQKYRYDSVYRADGSISDSVQISKRNSNNVSQISIGAFGHVYTRIRREINLGGMFGVSLSADQRIYYHAGLSALMGKNDRFVISTGVSIAKAKYLDSQYDDNQTMKRSLAPTAIPMEEVTRAGFFISLSYNLNLIK